MCPGSFANTLPVYQRSEVMLFIMGKIPVPGIYPALGSPNAGFEGSRMIQVMLLKSLLQVSSPPILTVMLRIGVRVNSAPSLRCLSVTRAPTC